jgi:hypothetical protein
VILIFLNLLELYSMKSKKADMYIKEGLFGEQEKEEVGE